MLQTTMSTLSDEDVESYVKETETPSADNLKGATQEVEKPKEEEKEAPIVDKITGKKEIQSFSEEDEKILTDAQSENKQDKPQKSSKPNKKDIESSIGYKDIVTFMIDEDGWEPEVELEGGQKVSLKDVPEEEFTPEVYASLLKYQNGLKVQKAISEEKSQYGNQAAELLDFLKDGGKLEDIAQYFQASKDIESINIDTEAGQEQIIREYYKATTNKSDEWIDEQIETFKDKGLDRLKKEALDNKTSLLESVKEQQSEAIKEQESIATQRKAAEARYNQAVREAIYKDNIPDREKRENEKYAFEYKFPHPQNPNVKVSQFYLDFQKIQNDPVKQYRLQQLIKNFDNVEDKTKVQSETNVKLHTFLRKNQSTLTKPSSATPEYEGASTSAFDWDKINKYLKK